MCDSIPFQGLCKYAFPSLNRLRLTRPLESLRPWIDHQALVRDSHLISSTFFRLSRRFPQNKTWTVSILNLQLRANTLYIL